MNYAFTSNAETVIKFYNLGNKSFETDFELAHWQLKTSQILRMNDFVFISMLQSLHREHFINSPSSQINRSHFMDKDANSFQNKPRFRQVIFNMSPLQDFARVNIVRYRKKNK